MGKLLDKKNIAFYFVLLFVMLVTRIFILDSFVATDETAWFSRSANFYYAMAQRDFAATYQNNSIAAFTMWINTMAFLIVFPGYRGMGQGYINIYDPAWERVFMKASITELDVLLVGRLLMVLSLIILAIAIFYYLKRILGFGPALFASLLIVLDPYYIALSRTSHLDAPMGTFLILSLLALHAYYNFGKKRFDFILSGITGGLSFLSKLTGLLVIPGAVGVTALAWVSKKTDNLKENRLSIIKYSKTLLVWGVLFLLTFFVIWPAMWVQPIQTLNRALLSPMNFIDTDIPSSSIESSVDIPDQDSNLLEIPRQAWNNFTFYLQAFLWRSTPVVLLGLIAVIFAYYYRWGLFLDSKNRSLSRMILFASLYFILLVSIPEMRGEKYIISSFLAFDILAGIGWFALIQVIAKKINRFTPPQIQIVFLVGLLAIQSTSVIDNFPYYFTYYNPLLGGGEAAGQKRLIGVGEGLSEAAMFLNQQPEAEKRQALSWYGKGPFSFFYDGETEVIPTGKSWSEGFKRKISESDYLVVYTNQWHREIPPELFVILDDLEPIHRVYLEDIEYVRIYRSEDVIANISP